MRGCLCVCVSVCVSLCLSVRVYAVVVVVVVVVVVFVVLVIVLVLVFTCVDHFMRIISDILSSTCFFTRIAFTYTSIVKLCYLRLMCFYLFYVC